VRKCVVSGVAFFAILSLALPDHASAQGVFIGAGGTLPTGTYGKHADPGWMVDAGVTFPLNENGLYVFANGLYGSNSHSDIAGNRNTFLGGFGGVELSFAEAGERGPFVFGQVGFLNRNNKSDQFAEYRDSETGLGFGGGAGYTFPIGGMSGWVLGRYIQGLYDGDDGNAIFFGVVAGVTLSFGGDGG